jgi:DNA-binding CsgD family transcriptional regulator
VLGYERQIVRLLTGQPALALCTHDLSASRGIDVLDVARLHTVAVARRRGEWQLFEAPPLRASAAVDAEALGSRDAAFPDPLTERERMVLARLLEGASAKEMGRDLGISPRTVEFHRANIIGKLGAKNTADLIRRVLARR